MQRYRQNKSNISIEVIRQEIVEGLLILMFVAGIIVNIGSILTFGGDPSFEGFSISAVSLVAFLLLRTRKFIVIASYLPVLLLVGMFLFVITPEGNYYGITEVLLLIITAIITGFRTFTAVSLLIIGWSIYLQVNAPPDTSVSYILMSIITVSIGTFVLFVINRFESISDSLSRTNRLLEGSSNIGQSVNENLDMQSLLDDTVNTVRDEFDFYHVQVFLIDDEYKYANLVASTGDAGRQLLARNHRLPVGSQSVIGRVAQVGEPVIAQNTDVDTVHALNELLPDTRAELALPLIDSGNIIGALDVQSVHADAFQPIDIQALQIIANQLAVAIRNARLFNEAQRNIQENKRLLFEYETNLREVDRLNRTLTKQSWDNYLTQSYVDGVTLSEERFAPQAEWSEIMRSATTSQQPQSAETDDSNTFAIPIILRGQVLGAIEVALDKQANANDAIEMVEAISQRLAISLESARLFEETQEATLQEQQINEIVSSYETALTIDELLQVTLEKLQQSLGAEKGTIRLGVTSPNGSATHHHNGNGGSPS